MLGAAYIQIHIAPILIGFLAHKRLVVVRVHISEIVGT